MLEDICFYSTLLAEEVTIANRKYSSFHSWCCLMNGKVKSFKQTAFSSEHCAMSKVTSVWSALFRPWHRP